MRHFGSELQFVLLAFHTLAAHGHIYVPIIGSEGEVDIVGIFVAASTDKEIVTVNAETIGYMGDSAKRIRIASPKLPNTGT